MRPVRHVVSDSGVTVDEPCDSSLRAHRLRSFFARKISPFMVTCIGVLNLSDKGHMLLMEREDGVRSSRHCISSLFGVKV